MNTWPPNTHGMALLFADRVGIHVLWSRVPDSSPSNTAMRTKLFTIIVTFSVALVCLGVAYLAGYARGHRAADRDATKFGLVSSLGLYGLQERGETNRLAARIRFMIFAYSDYYDRNFSGEPGADEYFLKNLAAARAIAGQERTNLVSVDSALLQINNLLRTNANK